MNRAQRGQFRLYMHFRHRNVSVSAMFLYNWRIYVVILATALGSVGAMLYLGQSFWVQLLAVAYAAIFLRDAGLFRKMKRTWPLTREPLDWSKVEQKVTEMKSIESGDRSGR